MLSAEEIERKRVEFWSKRAGLDGEQLKLFPKQLEIIEQRMGPITCADCALNDTCEFAWDFYNTNGDCLAEK